MNRAGFFGGGSTELEPGTAQRAIVIAGQRRGLLLLDRRDRAISADRVGPGMRLAVDAWSGDATATANLGRSRPLNVNAGS